jgi:hypothetical protein
VHLLKGSVLLLAILLKVDWQGVLVHKNLFLHELAEPRSIDVRSDSRYLKRVSPLDDNFVGALHPFREVELCEIVNNSHMVPEHSALGNELMATSGGVELALPQLIGLLAVGH